VVKQRPKGIFITNKVTGLLLLLIGLAGISIGTVVAEPSAQVTATPARINLSTATLPPTLQLVAETPTRTPTPQGLVVLEAITEANVRSEPDPESERLGTIRVGETYTVLGRYFRWIQFQYDPSPSGRGWVFDELVTITGDTSAILDLSEQAVPTVDPALLGSIETLEAVTLTPGGVLTVTANARIIPAPETANSSIIAESTTEVVNSLQLLPTYTYPPGISRGENNGGLELQPTLSPAIQAVEIANNIPPIAPILVLGGIGILGLLVSATRR
jgi:hypothetical protein